MGKTLEDLKEICKQTNTNYSGIEYLVNEYYVKTLGWTKDEAIAYAIKLFENGTINKIKVLGKKQIKSRRTKVNDTTK